MARQTRYQQNTLNQRRNRSELLSNSIGRLTKPMFGKRGLADGVIARDWNAIVGDAIATHSQPEKIAYAWRKRTNGILHLRVDNSAMATQLQHLEPQLLERINGHFGYQAVTRLRFLHGPLPKAALSPRQRKQAVPSESRQRELAKTLEGIEDPELRQALEKLGRVLPEN